MKLDRWEQAVDGPLSEEALRRKLERLGYSVSCGTVHSVEVVGDEPVVSLDAVRS